MSRQGDLSNVDGAVNLLVGSILFEPSITIGTQAIGYQNLRPLSSEQLSYQNTLTSNASSSIKYLTVTTTSTTTSTTTVVTTNNHTVLVQSVTSTQDPFAWFNDNPLVRTIVTIFGSIIAFALIIVTVVIVVRSKKVKRELRGLLHIDQDKPENDKS